MKKTYFLTPDFDSPPDGPIMLGHLLTDPDEPLEALNPDDRIALPEGIYFKTTKKGLTTTAKWNRELKVGLWAQILEGAIGGGIGIKNSKGTDDNLAVNAMETTFIWPAPAATKKYIKESLLLPGVKSYIEGSQYKHPVYMVVGLKIARKGASLTSETSKSHEEKAALMVDGKAAGVAAEVGPQYARKSTDKESITFEDTDDFVFAYRLRKIVCSKDGTFRDEAFDTGALFDSEGAKTGDDTIPFVVGKEDVTGEDLDGFGYIKILDEKDVDDDFGGDGEDSDEECVCVVPPVMLKALTA